MATGAPDWYYRNKADIVAQTIASLAVDIIAQSLGDLAVDINAQTIGNLAVDIAAQAIGNLAVDIAAQSVGDVDVNLAAQEVDIDVNLAAQDANIDIDIAAQTIGNIVIDVAAQTLSEIINRPTYGGGQSSSYSGNALAGLTTTLLTINGTGMVYGGYLIVADANSHKNDSPILEADSNTVLAATFSAMKTYKMLKGSGQPFTLTRYDDISHVYVVSVGYGLTFEEQLKLQYTNVEADTATISASLSYATI